MEESEDPGQRGCSDFETSPFDFWKQTERETERMNLRSESLLNLGQIHVEMVSQDH